MAALNLDEKANFTRLSRLLVDKGTEALRNIFDSIHPPGSLTAVLNAQRTTLLKLKPRVINDSQWNLLYPLSGNPPDSRNFDVTLLTVLLRNICGLTAPATGWNTMPPNTDRSTEANVTRIKLFRNQVYAHAPATQVDKTTFENLWQEISKTLLDLKVPRKDIDELKTCLLGPEEEIYANRLKEWFLKEEECKRILDDLSTNVQVMHQDLQTRMQHLTEIFEESRPGIQQPCQSSSRKSVNKRPCDSKEIEIDEKRVNTDEIQRLQKLAKHNFKSKIGRKVKDFHPSTRGWLLEKVDKWFTKEDESRLLLLAAGPGFGKSVFAAKVCELFQAKGELAACHFCDFGNSNLNDPMMMLESIASQMCESIDGFKEKLLDQLKRSHKVRTLKDAFQIYLQNPLNELEGMKPRLIVIDGLDESATDEKCELVKLIADYFPDLPECVKVLMTSRPDLSFGKLRHTQVMNMEAHNKRENQLDLVQYLKECLPSLANRSEIILAIVEKCQGSFLYASLIQDDLHNREDLNTMASQEIVSVLPEGLSSVYHAYFHRLETELEAVMKKNPDMFKLLEMLVATHAPLPLKFIARALDLDSDSRETKKIINRVNETVSCLLYVSEGLVTVFHKSVNDWLRADGYEEHEYSVDVGDGRKRLWYVCEQIYEEIKTTVVSGNDLKLTDEMMHALEYGHFYLLQCNMEDSFFWLVDMIIVHVVFCVFPEIIIYFLSHWQTILRSDVAIRLEIRRRVSWHLVQICNSFHCSSVDKASCEPFPYLEAVLDHSPEGYFSDEEKKIAKALLPKFSGCTKRISARPRKAMNPLLAKLFPFQITAVGVSSNKTLAAVALEDGTICILSLPNLVKLWQYATDYQCISCCTFSPDDSLVLYGKLEMVLSMAEKRTVSFFSKKVERFKACAFSPNGNRLVTSDGSNTVKLWDVVSQCLVSDLCAGVPLDCCFFSSTGLFIVGENKNGDEDSYSVWNAITLQRVDERGVPASKLENEGDIRKSERCNRCLQEPSKAAVAKWLRIVKCMRLNRHTTYVKRWENRHGTFSVVPETYNGQDCIFYLDEDYLRVIETVHFTTLAVWEIFVACHERPILKLCIAHITPIADDLWLYNGKDTLIVFKAVSPKEDPSCLTHPTRVLWCSFSPDGTRLCTCTTDGFINIWNVDTCEICQCFKSNGETSSAACWWSDKHLFVFQLVGDIPFLLKYPVGDNLEIVTTQEQPVSLFPVLSEFLPFSRIQDFSEGYLMFERGRTKPVKVLDVARTEQPQIVILPGIEPMMSIAVSSGASVIFGVGQHCFSWLQDVFQPSVYRIWSCRWSCDLTGASLENPLYYDCCLSGNAKLLSYVVFNRQGHHGFVAEQPDTGLTQRNEISGNLAPQKVFCTNTMIIHLTPKNINIHRFECRQHKEFSFHRHLARDFLMISKLSPKGNVLAIPRLNGDVELFQLRIPSYSLLPEGSECWKRLDGFKSITQWAGIISI